MLLNTLPICSYAQIGNVTDNISYSVSLNTTLSDGDHSPLWLNANRYGMSSVDNNSAWLRAGIQRDLNTDSLKNWKIGYGVDAALASGFTSTVVLQQLYAEAQYKRVRLTIGAKEQPQELKSQTLSTGGQTLGINARPVPMVRLSLPNYWGLSWLKVKGHIAYGMTTDNSWQKEFIKNESRYTENMLLHTKAGYIRIGKDTSPVTAELGLEMASQFGGTCYNINNTEGEIDTIKCASNLQSFWNALIPGGKGDYYENLYDFSNVEGNHLGSYLARINYNNPTWGVSLYNDHYFEDHSSMFLLDYDGYGTGDQWNDRINNRYFRYDLKDMLWGIEFRSYKTPFLKSFVVEWIDTRYQSGPIYHDHNQNMSDHIGGNDDYYNHFVYTGWQHWGQVMGNPLYLSPNYNNDGTIEVKNNRFTALHFGVEGNPLPNLYYRMLLTFQEGLGTYNKPYTSHKKQTYALLEAAWKPQCKSGLLKGATVSMAMGLDNGSITGDNFGATLSIKKEGILWK